MVNLLDLSHKIEQHLEQKLLPFWLGLKDQEHGGFFGGLSFDLKLEPQAVKGCILNSRILWSFANAYMFKPEPQYLEAADHAYRFMCEHCFDQTYGGIYWSMNYDGTVSDSTKHTYNQAFAIYALSSYYAATHKKEALEHAFALYEVIERKCKDERGYLESFNYKFEPEDNSKLSENGVMAAKTMNTLLHVFEGYAGLYQATGDPAVGQAMRRILDIYARKVYSPERHRQLVFFDEHYNSIIDLYSYGHDIESSWLIDWGCSLLGDHALTGRISAIDSDLAAAIYQNAYRDHSVINECERGVDDLTRVWWVQAEAVLGFVNEYEKSGDEKYAAAAADVWHFICDHLVDRRPGGEWFWCLDDSARPEPKKPIVEPWKCPYHNGRLCLELMRRDPDVQV